MAEVCRKHGVSEQTVYRWRNKYGGLETSELQRLRELEAENGRLNGSSPSSLRYLPPAVFAGQARLTLDVV